MNRVQLQPNTMGTVIDKEVAIASQSQGLAPAGAVPPIMLSTLGPAKTNMFVGAPVMPNRHQRASPALSISPEEQAVYDRSKKISQQVTKEMIKVGGFHDSPGATYPLYAIPEGPKAYLGDVQWKMHLPHVPKSMKQSPSQEHLTAGQLASMGISPFGKTRSSNGMSRLNA